MVVGKLEGRLDPQYHQAVYIDENIRTRRLGDLVEYIKEGYNPGSASYVDTGIPYLRVHNIQDNEIVIDDGTPHITEELFNQLRRYQPQVGEILLTKDGSLGRAALVETDIKAIINTGIIRLLPKADMNPYYLTAVLNSPVVRTQFERVGVGATIKHIHVDKVKDIQIPVLPLSAQVDVNRRLKIVYENIAKAQKAIETGKREIEDIFTGLGA
jgi:restriction endonuclease S subunit